MGLPGDDRVTDLRTQREPAVREGAPEAATRLRLGGGEGRVVPFRPRRASLAERLEREWQEQERADRERRARIERERKARERELKERLERRRQERLERLRREREAMRRRGRRRRPGRRATEPTPQPASPEPASAPRAQVRPSVQGPVRKRERSAENRRRAAARRKGLFLPTAKAGMAVSVVLALGAAVGTALGLPVPGLSPSSGSQTLVANAAAFGVDPGTPPGLAPGYVFPIEGQRDFGNGLDRFGAPRAGHIHEGQDIFAKPGTPEVAVHDGVVVDRGKNTDPDSGGRGNYLAIYDPADNHSFVYMHMLQPSPVLVGHHVHAGEVIGKVGCTGDCDGPHLHFEVRIGKASLGAETKPVDPLPYLRQWPQPTPG